MTSTVRPLWIARLAGTHEEMGHQHGTLCAAAGGGAALDHYRDMPERMLVGGYGAIARAAAGAIKEAALRRLERDRPPALVARTRAFMRALGRPIADARYVAVMDVLQNAVGAAARLGAGPFGANARAGMVRAAQPACSSAMVWGAASEGGELRHARNFDFPGNGVWDAGPALILCAPTGGMRYAFVTTRGADTPVVTVWNEAGLVIAPHTRFHRAVGWGGTAIIDLVHQIAARAETLAEAEAIARTLRTSSSWGLAVSSARERRACVLEVHADRLEVIAPPAGADSLTCANRYRHPRMQDGEATASFAWSAHSDGRERRLRTLIAEARAAGGADAGALCRMLADREDPAAPGVVRRIGGVVGQPITVHSAVVEPMAQRIVLAVGAAPVVDGPYLAVRYQWDGPVGAWEVSGAAIDRQAGVNLEAIDVGVTRDAASIALAEVARIEQETHDAPAMAVALERAIAAAPDDPSLRLAALWTYLRTDQWNAAMAHARLGLDTETIPYRRAQLLRWGARAALAVGDEPVATAWHGELDALRGDGVDEEQARARRDRRGGKRYARRRPEVNLLLCDAT
ncbi:MAG: hypothetical protein K8W52_09380 [Deltaproteobacteria bacterium]|nr:hypothetical protein [Deltaproteobacteria bacterium]